MKTTSQPMNRRDWHDGICPWCGAETFHYESIEIEEGSAYQRAACGADGCKAEWTNAYRLDTAILFRDPAGNECGDGMVSLPDDQPQLSCELKEGGILVLVVDWSDVAPEHRRDLLQVCIKYDSIYPPVRITP